MLGINKFGVHADQSIQYLCDLIDQLTGQAKVLWDTADSKVFDLGFGSGDEGAMCGLMLDHLTIQCIEKIGATIAITVYPIRPVVQIEDLIKSF